MKKNRAIIITLSIIGLVLVIWNNYINYVEASKPKIAEDIRASDSALLLDEFGISLPPEAKITVFSFTENEIKIRIEGVENLPAFLMDSIYLGIDEVETESLSEIIYRSFNHDTNSFADIYGINHQKRLSKKKQRYMKNNDK